MPTIIINSVSKLGSSLCFDLIPDKMFVRRYLGFVLLVWFQGVLYVQASNQPCSAPSLNGGYLVPEQDTYIHETKLSYGCDNGHKPAVEGWWATSTCENGKWSHKPQCIDEKACVPPTFPNAIYTVRTNGWYGENDIIRITCDDGYEYKGRDATAQCINGSWSSVPVCEKSIHACGEPPQIPHAVIILQGYQDFFAVDTELQYECEDGFTLEGANTTPYIYCVAGNWSDGPVCSRGPGTGHGGSGGHVTSASGTQPGSGVKNCGTPPVVPNGDIVRKGQALLKYQCARLYKLVGSELVECYADGTWSEVPSCKVDFCSVDTDQNPDLISVGVQHIQEGEKMRLACVNKSSWWTDHYSEGICTDLTIKLSRCCSWVTLDVGRCK